MANVQIIGGGPAGLMAAYSASLAGHTVTLFEKNTQLGKKLQLTGHGRCNITNACTKEEFFTHIVHNARFLYSSFAQFSNQDLLAFLKANGCPTIQEENGRVFPSTNSAVDVILCFIEVLKKQNVTIKTNEPCLSIQVENQKVKGITTPNGFYPSDGVIVTTGGMSFPTTGSTGDGYQFAKDFGLTIQPCLPGLVSIHSKDVIDLAGLSLEKVQIQVKQGKKVLYKETGPILFTHQGLSGPTILNASNFLIKKDCKSLQIDFVPSKSLEECNQLLLKALQKHPNKTVQHSLEDLLPKRFVQYLLVRVAIDAKQKCNTITKEKRLELCQLLKACPFSIDGYGDFHEAMVTVGGISVKAIDPKTMASKKIPNLKFAGEVLDLDGQTGGYNLQIAWSTGYVAGATI